jgi:hypothetical protein
LDAAIAEAFDHLGHFELSHKQAKQFHEQRDRLAAEVERLRAALDQIVGMDFALNDEGRHDLYSGPGRFVNAWLVANAALAKDAKASK